MKLFPFFFFFLMTRDFLEIIVANDWIIILESHPCDPSACERGQVNKQNRRGKIVRGKKVKPKVIVGRRTETGAFS